MLPPKPSPLLLVNRRVGGLEILDDIVTTESRVNRRVGGLEIFQWLKIGRASVNRRVGGLETYNASGNVASTVTAV